MKTHTHLAVTLIVAGSLLSLKTILADTPPINLRDARYCEILLGTGGLIIPKEIDVYNTIGLNKTMTVIGRLSARRTMFIFSPIADQQ